MQLQVQQGGMSKELVAIMATTGFTFLTTIFTVLYNGYNARLVRRDQESEARRIAVEAAKKTKDDRDWDLAKQKQQREWDLQDRADRAKAIKDDLERAQFELALSQRRSTNLVLQRVEENSQLTRSGLALNKEAIVAGEKAFEVANNVNHKLLTTNEAQIKSAQEAILEDRKAGEQRAVIKATGEDTNQRVLKLEHELLDDGVRGMKQTGEDTNEKVHAIQHKLDDESLGE